MKKIGSFFVTLGIMLVMIFSLAGCGNDAKPTSYYINSEGNLIVVLDDGKENDLGKWGENIVSSFKNITISDDGYYVIDGIKTNIAIGDAYVKGVTNIEISEDGFYVVNGVKTSISAINIYTVSFDTGFSTKVQDQKVKEGYKVEKPSISRTGYEFDGWYCNGEEWLFNSNTVTNDMTLTAEWHAKSYSLVFDEDGGESVTDIKVTYDSNYSLPSTSKALYTFGGWMLNNQVVNSNGVWKNDGDEIITLKAKWTRTTHNVIFDSNGGSSVQNLVVNSYSQIDTLPIPSWTDHTFLGWKNNDSLVELPLQMEDTDIHLTASWKGVSDDFEFFDASDNTITITKYIGDGTIVTVPEKISNKNVKTLAENAFDGCSNVTTIILPSGLTNLEFKSLYGATSLEKLTISGNAGGSLKYFYGNNEDNVPLSLKTIIFAEGSSTYSKDIFNELSTTHLFKVELPASVKVTPSDVFYKCENIYEAVIPYGVTTLSDRTFCNCTNLVKVSIPSSVTSLGTNCFANVPNLPYLIIPSSVKSFGYASVAATESLILFESTEKTGSSSKFSIYEDDMDIYYGFEEIKSNDTFVYALCKVGSIKQAIIISLVDGASMPGTIPDSLDGYPVVLNRAQ